MLYDTPVGGSLALVYCITVASLDNRSTASKINNMGLLGVKNRPRSTVLPGMVRVPAGARGLHHLLVGENPNNRAGRPSTGNPVFASQPVPQCSIIEIPLILSSIIVK